MGPLTPLRSPHAPTWRRGAGRAPDRSSPWAFRRGAPAWRTRYQGGPEPLEELVEARVGRAEGVEGREHPVDLALLLPPLGHDVLRPRHPALDVGMDQLLLHRLVHGQESQEGAEGLLAVGNGGRGDLLAEVADHAMLVEQELDDVPVVLLGHGCSSPRRTTHSLSRNLPPSAATPAERNAVQAGGTAAAARARCPRARSRRSAGGSGPDSSTCTVTVSPSLPVRRGRSSVRSSASIAALPTSTSAASSPSPASRATSRRRSSIRRPTPWCCNAASTTTASSALGSPGRPSYRATATRSLPRIATRANRTRPSPRVNRSTSAGAR